MRRGHHSVAEILRQALPPKSRERIFSVELMKLRWPSLVGRELADRSEPARFDARVLTIRVEDARWGKMILKLEREIRRRLETSLGVKGVKKIQFVRDGRPIARTPPDEPVAPLPDEPEAPSAIGTAAKAVEDPVLRSFLIRTASRYLAAQAARRRMS